MAATQYSDYYYSNNISSYQHYQSVESQQQNLYNNNNNTYGQYDCKNLNATDAFNNYNYNFPPNNYNDQWSSYYSTIQQQQPQYHHQNQQLSMLNNQINDDYKNYSHHNYNGTTIKSSTQAAANGNQPNLNCNQYGEMKNDLYYEPQHFAQSTAIASATTSQLAGDSRKRKIDNVAAASDDSPALRALLTKPSKRTKYVKSPYFYQHHTGNVSPASSTSEHYQMPASIVNVEQSINLVNYKSPLKEGYESSIDEIKAAVSVASPISSNYATPPSSPKDTSLKHDDSAHSGAAIWNEQNEGKFFELNFLKNF